MLLWNQQGERETTEHTLGRAAPLTVLLVDIEELAGVGQVIRREAEVVADLRPYVDLFAG